jgi:hypothetical protein
VDGAAFRDNRKRADVASDAGFVIRPRGACGSPNPPLFLAAGILETAVFPFKLQDVSAAGGRLVFRAGCSGVDGESKKPLARSARRKAMGAPIRGRLIDFTCSGDNRIRRAIVLEALVGIVSAASGHRFGGGGGIAATGPESCSCRGPPGHGKLPRREPRSGARPVLSQTPRRKVHRRAPLAGQKRTWWSRHAMACRARPLDRGSRRDPHQAQARHFVLTIWRTC